MNTPDKGRPFDPIRWTLERASREFGMDKKTLSGRVKRAGILPGPDGNWSTAQIAAAVFGDLESERIRETRSKADLNEQKLATEQNRLVDRDDFARTWQDRFLSMVRIIKSSKLSEDEQHAIQTELAGVLK